MNRSFTYIPIEEDETENKPRVYKKRRFRKCCRFLKNVFIIFFTLLYIAGLSIGMRYYRKYFLCIEPRITDKYFFKIKGEPNIDKYGIDLNQYMQKEMYNQKIPGNNTLEEWDLYTPPCPNLSPIHYSEDMLNPKCEDLTLQISDFTNQYGRGKPHSLHLHTITNQIKKWNEWSKREDKVIPNYYNHLVENMVTDNYHPFDYGYYDEQERKLNTEEEKIEYYKKVVNSRMDEVPDPSHRRLFMFILFNTEFDLLDLFLSEYYELVDYFVIYESNATFSGKVKPLYFTRMLMESNRYDKFKDKIIAFPLPMEKVCRFYRHPFTKEHLARRQLIEMGLRGVQARHGDLFLHGDLDELPKPHILARLKRCGGWEHLQAGIGGGPQSSKYQKVDSYLQDKKLNKKLERDKYGFPKLVYDRELSIAFLNWFYEYSFNIVEDSSIGTKATPSIAIFDARRALGQYPKKYTYTEAEGDGNIMVDNKYSKYNRRSPNIILSNNDTIVNNEKNSYDDNYVDPLTQPGFDPYKGYGYTRNEDDDKDGEGFLGEYMRFTSTGSVYKFYDRHLPVFWSGGWHMSTFLPTVDHFLNKVLSYSHFDTYSFIPQEERRKEIIERIEKNSYIFGEEKLYDRNTIVYPPSPEKGYPYDFTLKTWSKFTNLNQEYKEMKDILYHEIPTAVWKNPICYAYMIDRRFGLDKKLWWQAIPKDQWATVDFDNLDKETLEEITPPELPKAFKPKPLREEKS